MSPLQSNLWVLCLIALAMTSVLGVKYTTPDDISVVWHLYPNLWLGAQGHAISTGRVWTIVADIYAYIILVNRHSDILIYGIDIFVTFLLYKLIEKVFNRNIALAWLLLFLSLVPIGWWYNILLAYPGFYLNIGLVAISSLFFRENVIKGANGATGSRSIQALGIFFYSISIFHYEIFSIISFALILGIFAKYAQVNIQNVLRYLSPYLMVNIVYVLIYIAWKKAYPLDYDGSTFNYLNSIQFLEYFEKIVLSGLSLNNFVFERDLKYFSNIYQAEFIVAKFDLENLIMFYRTTLWQLLYPALFGYISYKLVFKAPKN